MAQRRMFSLKITSSAKFLKMPVSSQLLYFHFGLHADDDGVVEGYNVMRMTSCTEDDLKILVAKEFVIVLNEDLVSYVTHWNEHNLIRGDRRVPSIYKDLLIQFTSHKYLEEEYNNGLESQMTTICQTNDRQMTDKCQHRLGKVRLGKVKLGKDSIVKDVTEKQKSTKVKEDKELTKNKYLERVFLTKEEYELLLKKYSHEDNLQKGIEILNNYIQAKEPKYKSHYHVLIGWVHERVIQDVSKHENRHEANTRKNTGNEGSQFTFRQKDYL